jgi:hypothetical protein
MDINITYHALFLFKTRNLFYLLQGIKQLSYGKLVLVFVNELIKDIKIGLDKLLLQKIRKHLQVVQMMKQL